MLNSRPLALLFSLSPLSISIAHAQSDSLSLNGFSGLFNIPSAHVTTYGTGAVSYSNMMFYQLEYKHNRNIVGSFGVFPHVEIGGRIAWFDTHSNNFNTNSKPRDLSANIKINIPYIPDDWFELAVGEQDIGGEANFFDAKYIVASKSLGPIRIDAGVGQNELNNRLDGAFGGIEYSPFDWISLIAEYDAQDTNTGFRLSTPQNWIAKDFRLELTVLANTTNDASSGRSFYGVSMNFPLGGNFSGSRPQPLNTKPVAHIDRLSTKNQLWANNKYTKPQLSTTQTDTPPNPTPETPTKLTTDAQEIANAFEQEGFERIDTSVNNGSLTIAFENNIYNHSELDAIGVALSIVADQGKSFKRATLILKNQNLPMIAINTNPDGYAAFLESDNAAPIYVYYPPMGELNTISWQSKKAYQSSFKPRITVTPLIVNGIATEYGVWDYSWGLALNATSHLWPGALVSATHVEEISNSDDFEDGVFRNSKLENGLEEATFQQGFKLGSQMLTNMHFGRFRYDYQGFQNETLVFTSDGEHQLSLKLGDFEHKDTNEQRDYQLLTYRWYIPEYDIAIRTTAGEFWGGDDGYRINTLFRFGDQTIDLFYKNTDAEFIGLAWSLPLTPEKDWSSKYLQVKGHEAWRWGLQTRIGETQNAVAFGVADVPRMDWEIERTYLNNDKLSPEYIYHNLDRLKRIGNQR